MFKVYVNKNLPDHYRRIRMDSQSQPRFPESRVAQNRPPQLLGQPTNLKGKLVETELPAHKCASNVPGDENMQVALGSFGFSPAYLKYLPIQSDLQTSTNRQFFQLNLHDSI